MKSCLIVDDSKVIRKVARHILETLEFDVEEAGDGQEALSRCEANMPDVVLLDWNMPVMSGMEFLKLLRQRGHSDQPKVVFCTTENDMAHIRAALEAGADEYVMKPFDRETLHIKLQLVGIVLLDLEMPGAGGLKAMPRIIGAAAGAKVMIVSSLADEGAEQTVAALAMGAADTLPKPGTGRFNGRFSEILLNKLKALGYASVPVPEPAAHKRGSQALLRAMPTDPIDVLAI